MATNEDFDTPSARMTWNYRLSRLGVMAPVRRIRDAWLHRCHARAGTFAQAGEDLFVAQYFHDKPEGLYIDAGANHPYRLSNTYLAYRRGWRGVTLEPIPQLYRRHVQVRPRDMHLNCAAGDRSGELTFCELFPGCLSTFDVETAGKLVSQGRVFWLAKYTVQVVTLADVCRTFLPGRQVDLLSVDTEGFDLQVLAGLDLNVNRPSLIISETDVAGEEKGDAIQEFLRQHSYHRIQVLGYNAFYAPNS